MNNTRLLILTQAVDASDPVLGFFHNWIRELAQTHSSIVVICLKKGMYTLPENVSVHSLGKEDGCSRLTYVRRFFRYVWNARSKYDTVFVHMNEEYVLLGGLLWRLLGKQITMWRNHARGTWKTRMAVFLCHTVFCASLQSFTARFKKTHIMPVGIDTSVFHPLSLSRDRTTILYIGRVSRVKRIEVLIDACMHVAQSGNRVSLAFYGPVLDTVYFEELKERIRTNGLEKVITFHAEVTQAVLPELYATHGICVNTTDSGSFDKTILEGACCEIVPLASNTNWSALVGQKWDCFVTFREYDADDLAKKILQIYALSDDEYVRMTQDLARMTRDTHSLRALVTRITPYLCKK